MKPIRVAVIGVGHLGSIHARIYSQLESAQLVAVCDTLPDRLQQIASTYGCRAVADYREILKDVDAVSIAVPTHLHYPIAKDFLSAGVHTLIEKPITGSLREADHLLKLGRKKRLILQVGHVERFNATLTKVRSSLTNPRFIEVHRLAPFQPRGTEVGVVLDLMIHDIDILLWLVKSRIRKIEAVGVRVMTPFEDIANARITFANGAVANLTASRISKDGMRKFRIFQHGGYVSMDFLGQAADIFQLANGGIKHERLTISGEEPLKAELSAFVQSIHQKTTPPVSGEEAREALSVALKVTQLVHKNHP
jgi:predicted dehydrogenase